MRIRACVIALTLVIPSVASLTPVASAQVFWDEAVDGDLSNNRLAPTAVSFDIGTHTLLATTGGGNLDYLTITIPDGTEFSELRLVSYQGSDLFAFAAIQSGPIITETPEAPVPGHLLGWVHFGPGQGNVGTDILDDMGRGFGAAGFTPPLPSGTYAFWLQQLAPAVSYQFDFIVRPVPAPTFAAMLAVAGFAGVRRRRG